jgi:hypothetical protein
MDLNLGDLFSMSAACRFWQQESRMDGINNLGTGFGGRWVEKERAGHRTASRVRWLILQAALCLLARGQFNIFFF